MYGKSFIYLPFLLLCFTINKSANGMSIGIRTGCDGRSKCIILQECGAFMKYIELLEAPMKPSGVEFLMRQQCGFQEGHPKVCCSISTSNMPSTYFEQPPATGKDHPDCTAKSQCMLLKECKPYMDLIKSLEKPLAASVVDFLRAQQCGFQEGYPKVCCSKLPRGMLVKSARPGTRPTTSPFRSENTAKPSTALDLVHTVPKTTTSPPKSTVNRKLKEKSEALNKDFDVSDFFDFDGPYNLFRRKRFNDDGVLEVEIR